MIDKTDHGTILNSIYQNALAETSEDNMTTCLPSEVQNNVTAIINRSEFNKGLYTVVITLFTHKILDPPQDSLKHQTQIPGGFAGRGKDTQYITPFLKSVGFPAMAESGWLTRSLEQVHPYDLNYPGSIKPKTLKSAFLELINQVEVEGIDPEAVLTYMMKLLIKQRDERNIELAKPHSLSISTIISVLEKHFDYHYSCHGASRLPTLAIYAAYQCMMSQVSRFNDKVLCELESHTSADSQSGQIGDIQVNNEDGSAFEGIEIKHNIKITPDLVQHAFEKFMVHRTDRYYLLTTANMDAADWDGINNKIQQISRNHGCQVIVNGVYSSLKYYLRLLNDPADFIDKYVELLKADENIKYPHQVAWNEIISNLK